MRVSRRNLLIGLPVLAAFAVGIAVYRHSKRTSFLMSDPRHYYGELRLQPPIKHSGFSYFLDGGTITTVLSDANGVELPLSFSPPGEFFGDTEVFIGTREQMWADYHARNETHDRHQPEPQFQAARVPRESELSQRIAGYVADAVRTMEQEYAQVDAQNEWERWHINEYARCNKVFGERIHHILTSETPVVGPWGYGQPHGPMPDSPE